jgi:hypothetical protein
MNWRSWALAFPLLLAMVVTLWLRYQPLSVADSGYSLEMDLISPTSGQDWLQYDLGNGRNFHDLRIFWVTEGSQPRTYRVALPAGSFRSFEILPPVSVHQVLAGARIIAPDGIVAARLPASGDVPGRNLIAFKPQQPIEITAPGDKSWAASMWDFVLCAAAFVLCGALLKRRATPLQAMMRSTARGIVDWVRKHPQMTLLVVAAMAVTASCYPVVFFGKSFVSPNNGVLCLYDVHPTLPGAPAQPVEPWNGSDINATMWAHLPYSAVAHDAILRDGELPLWNRYVMGGLTLLGQGQSMIGDPLYWLTVLANGASWAWDVRFLLSKMIFAFGVGLIVWKTARSLGIAALLTFSSAFLGFFSYRFNHPAFFSVSYAPWVLLCWLYIAEATTLQRAGWWALALIGANWLELNSGTAKEASMLLLGLNGAGVLALLLRSESWLSRGKKLVLAALACCAFLAISAPVWVVFLDALQRGMTIYDEPLTNQISPGLLVGLFDDLFFRELMENEWHVDPALNFLVLLGLLWAFADPRRWFAEPAARALVIVSGLALAVVFGVVPPSWIDRLPFFKNISHVDDTFICVLIVPLFALAGLGLRNCVAKMRVPVRWRSDWIVTLIVLCGLAGLYFGTAQAVPRQQEFGLQLIHPTKFSPFFATYALALFAAVALLPWLVRWFLLGRGSRPANALAAFLCLVVLHFRHGMWLETKFDTYVMNPQERIDLRAPSPAVDFIRERQREPSRTVGFGQILRPGFNMVLRLESPFGADAVTMLALAQWYEAAGLGGMTVWWPTLTKASLSASRPFYDAMNVRYYLGSPASADQLAPGLEKVAAADLEVFESKSAWPRAFFTDRLGQYQDIRLLSQWVKSGDGRPFAAVLAGEANAPALAADQTSRRIAAARDYRLTCNTTSFTLDAPDAGIAVLNESFVPDNFRARVNGRLTPCFRVNHIFKGVALPGPGSYHVQFEYWPRPLAAALYAALGGLLFVTVAGCALWLVPWFARRI